jgi:exodeoxyribonuclease VII small subunit
MPPNKHQGDEMPKPIPSAQPEASQESVESQESLESLDPASFNAAYEVLRRNAELLREHEELDIDRLVPLVEQSMQAYRLCRSRLDAVRLALESRLGPDEGAVVAELSDQ